MVNLRSANVDKSRWASSLFGVNTALVYPRTIPVHSHIWWNLRWRGGAGAGGGGGGGGGGAGGGGAGARGGGGGEDHQGWRQDARVHRHQQPQAGFAPLISCFLMIIMIMLVMMVIRISKDDDDDPPWSSQGWWRAFPPCSGSFQGQDQLPHTAHGTATPSIWVFSIWYLVFGYLVFGTEYYISPGPTSTLCTRASHGREVIEDMT